MNIFSFVIDKTDLIASSTIRNFVVSGDPGASAKLYIRNEDVNYYNFTGTVRKPTSNGAGSSATTMYLDSTEGLVIGMSLMLIQSGSPSGSPVINSIDSADKSVVLSVAQTWADGQLITFQGPGFQAEFSPSTTLDITIPTSGNFRSSVVIPTVTDDDKYDFHLYVDLTTDTVLDSALSKENKYFYETSIKQKANRVITFAVATTDTDGFGDMPSNETLTYPASAIGPWTVDFKWTVPAADSTDGGGLELTRQPLDTDFKTSKVPSTVGAVKGSSSKIMYLDSVDGLLVGMSLTNITSGSVSGSPVINSINAVGKSVTLSVAQAWASDKAVTFKGGGTINIQNSSGASIVFSDLQVALSNMTATVASAVTAATAIVLTESYGIRVGAGPITGIGMNNSTPQFVTGTTYGSNTIAVTSAQTLAAGVDLTFIGCGKNAVITGRATVKKMPRESTTLTLDLDSLLTSALT